MLIIEKIVKIAARNKNEGRYIIEVLLKRKPNILIIEGVVRAVASSKSRVDAIILLLN